MFFLLFLLFYPQKLKLTSLNVNKNPTDATVCKYLFTAKLLYLYRKLRVQFLILLMMGAVTPEICRVALQ